MEYRWLMEHNHQQKTAKMPPFTKYTYSREGIECVLFFDERRKWRITINGITPDAKFKKPESCIEELVGNEVMTAWGVDSQILALIPLELDLWKRHKA